MSSLRVCKLEFTFLAVLFVLERRKYVENVIILVFNL